MITIRKSTERGASNFGWLDSKHTFSFGHYYDPGHMGFGTLRVINEDVVTGGAGFGTHPHDNMEIISYVLDGALAHKDSLGTGSVIRPGDVQRMTAGTGIAHSEFNASPTEPVHFLQIWVLPEKRNLAPGYEQKSFPPGERRGRLQLVGARDGRDGAVTIHQDLDLHVANLAKGDAVTHALAPHRKVWVQVTRGEVTVNGTLVGQGDGAALTDETEVKIAANDNAEILLFDIGA
ncbi:MAG: pirin family protein [Hyphomicrobium zavarzinii]|uniref:pirin family protein n=1 Tax=Hyphomicrobium zavarzinii TaxID=48292 RepID=UPI001A5F4164|nr:pirin family protein [Hyphomicrobium zavarzinii]MBL8847486.1 pirin family protein [Hyphomicrobium zavarzinii]